MSAEPRGHVVLRDEFVHASEDRLYLANGATFDLSPVDVEILACLERGESEFSLLCRRLASLDQPAESAPTRSARAAGGDVERIARLLLQSLAHPNSVMEFREPLELVEPEVIVSSFTPQGDADRIRALLRRLRKRHRVLHFGIDTQVKGIPRENLTLESANEAGAGLSSFQFLQLVRSLAGFHRRAVLVLDGAVDLALLGDLLADRPGVVLLAGDWPPAVELQDLRGADALVRDPRRALRALFYAMRFASLKEPGFLQARSSTDIATLSLYGLRRASAVLWSRADQPEALARVGRESELDTPALIVRARRARPEASDLLALAFDTSALATVAPLLGVLKHALDRLVHIRRVAVRVRGAWCELELKPGVATLTSWTAKSPHIAEVACAIAFPGLMQDVGGLADLLEHGVPVLYYPGGAGRPVQRVIPDVARFSARTPEEVVDLLNQASDPSSQLHAQLTRASREIARTWDVAGVVERSIATHELV